MFHLRLTARCNPRSFPFTHRLYTTQLSQPPPVLSPNHSIYISNSTNPYFNLSLEDWLFRHKNPKEPLLLLYRDSPCVVIGRNQNPWKEVNVPVSRKTGVPFIRRRSGGGTVYHDLGNTNFSLHLPRSSFDRHSTAQTVLRAVRSLNIDANVNDRNDICVGKDKVSGSAYKIVNNRAYHHGTMLIDSKLDMLGKLLHANKDTMHTKGVASVRSPVRNLRHFNKETTHDKFVSAVVKHFRLDYDIDVDDEVHVVEEDTETTSIEYIRRGMQELDTWDWVYGQTPEFTYTVERDFAWGHVSAEIRSKHGVILDCTLTCLDAGDDWKRTVGRITEWVKGKRYGFLIDEDDGGLHLKEQRDRYLRDWLARELSESSE